jgi:hypothetical protein
VKCAGVLAVVVVLGDVVVVVGAIGSVAVVVVAATVVDVDAAVVVGAVTSGLYLSDCPPVVVVTFLDTVSRSGFFPPPPNAIEPKMKTAIAPTAEAATTHRRLRIA